MASGTLVGGGGDGSRDKHRWAESKVYTRKSHNKSSSKPTVTPTSQSLPAAGAAVTDDVTSSQLPDSHFEAASDDSSSLPPNPTSNNGFIHNRFKISISSRSKHEIRELRRRLTSELDQVRDLVKRLDARGSQLNGGYSHSQLSANDGPKRGRTSEVAFGVPHNAHRQLSVSMVENSTSDVVEKEKRTPKANQYYRNSDFLLGKEKLPPSESNKKLKPTSSGVGGRDKQMAQAFKHCMNLLMKLIKHKHGWVFDKPVDVKALGLHDYYTIIKNPMDLGTVKARLESNWYKSPREFAEDVRLTFRNAMTYNPKGQDVHIMAEHLSKLFLEKWAAIELEYNLNPRFDPDQEVVPPTYLTKKTQAHAPPPEMRRTLERSESTTVPADPKPTMTSVTTTGRVAAPKKPKAKDPHKRDMTYEEKQRLSTNLLSLPSEKLDNIVQIIKKRNSALSQHDDEIEVDIDSFDVETLWELDRFVTNYKKSLSKNKRKAELAIQARGEADHNPVQQVNPVPVAVEASKENQADERNVSSSLPVHGEKHGDNVSRSSSSSSSSSDSGSSSSDSDSDSSSAGSDVGRSPRT
ncbi:transcription factor GTE4-like isoform X2 [Aristolochia californica]|uniref:transcription factor GTE4-like isoform X2 n=1 Tax=Aristolochia californica TaxID=171875 RepID=UPI0035D75DA5